MATPFRAAVVHRLVESNEEEIDRLRHQLEAALAEAEEAERRAEAHPGAPLLPLAWNDGDQLAPAGSSADRRALPGRRSSPDDRPEVRGRLPPPTIGSGEGSAPVGTAARFLCAMQKAGWPCMPFSYAFDPISRRLADEERT